MPNIDWVDIDDLVAEAVSWGMASKRAQSAVADVAERVWHAVHAVDLPEGTSSVLARLDELWRRRGWRTTDHVG